MFAHDASGSRNKTTGKLPIANGAEHLLICYSVLHGCFVYIFGWAESLVVRMLCIDSLIYFMIFVCYFLEFGSAHFQERTDSVFSEFLLIGDATVFLMAEGVHLFLDSRVSRLSRVSILSLRSEMESVRCLGLRGVSNISLCIINI